MKILTFSSTTSTDSYDVEGGEKLIRLYEEHGYCTIPVKAGQEATCVENWPDLAPGSFSSDYFRDKNVALGLGSQSGGLVDVDIDENALVPTLTDLLPKTSFRFGRESRPSTHFIYAVSEPLRHFAIRDPQTKRNLVELRGSGHYTVVPPSSHSGERVRFAGDWGPAPAVELRTLVRAVQTACIAYALAPYWTEGTRHDVSLSLSGAFAKWAWTESETATLIFTIATLAGDNEVEDRLRAVQSTFGRVLAGTPVATDAQLEGLIPATMLSWVREQATRYPGRPGQGLVAPSPTSMIPAMPTSMSDIDLARWVVKQLDGGVAFCHTTGRWFVKEQQLMRIAQLDELYRLVTEVIEPIAAGDLRKSLFSYSRIKTIAASIATVTDATVDSLRMDRAETYIGDSRNRVLNIAEPFAPFSGNELISKKLGTYFDPDATAPLWDATLLRCLGSPESVQYLQKVVGYSLTTNTSERKMWFLLGGGANGKSLVMKVLGSVFGEYADVTSPSALLVDQAEKTYELAKLEGKRLVFIQEMESGHKIASARFKRVTGSEPIAIEEKYKAPRTIHPVFKFMIATNEMPALDCNDDALWDRINVIPFPNYIPPGERDRELFEKLKAELPGILNWAIAGYHSWKAGGLAAPSSVLAATAKAREERDLVGRWIRDCCAADPAARTSVAELKRSLDLWCMDNGVSEIPSAVLGKALRRRGYKDFRMSSGNGYHGIRLQVGGETVRQFPASTSIPTT
jgi:putative DNA primase/helicase